jgi:hypothetical protein
MASTVAFAMRDLADHVQRGAFREDLSSRLKVLTLYVPPLRERREDIVPLAERFVLDDGRLVRFSPAAERALMEYSWPGNVRELANAVKHGLALAEGHVIGVEHLPDEIVRPREPSPAPVGLRRLADVEREHVLRVLEACSGSQLGREDPGHRPHDAVAQAPRVRVARLESDRGGSSLAYPSRASVPSREARSSMRALHGDRRSERPVGPRDRRLTPTTSAVDTGQHDYWRRARDAQAWSRDRRAVAGGGRVRQSDDRW